MTGFQHNCPACGHRIEDIPQVGRYTPDRKDNGDILSIFHEVCEECGATLHIFVTAPLAKCDIKVHTFDSMGVAGE